MVEISHFEIYLIYKKKKKKLFSKTAENQFVGSSILFSPTFQEIKHLPNQRYG